MLLQPDDLVVEGMAPLLLSPAIQDLLKRMEEQVIISCAMQGHSWCDNVPGIEGTICLACGKRPQEIGGKTQP